MYCFIKTECCLAPTSEILTIYQYSQHINGTIYHLFFLFASGDGGGFGEWPWCPLEWVPREDDARPVVKDELDETVKVLCNDDRGLFALVVLSLSTGDRLLGRRPLPLFVLALPNFYNKGKRVFKINRENTKYQFKKWHTVHFGDSSISPSMSWILPSIHLAPGSQK